MPPRPLGGALWTLLSMLPLLSGQTANFRSTNSRATRHDLAGGTQQGRAAVSGPGVRRSKNRVVSVKLHQCNGMGGKVSRPKESIWETSTRQARDPMNGETLSARSDDRVGQFPSACSADPLPLLSVVSALLGTRLGLAGKIVIQLGTPR